MDEGLSSLENMEVDSSQEETSTPVPEEQVKDETNDDLNTPTEDNKESVELSNVDGAKEVVEVAEPEVTEDAYEPSEIIFSTQEHREDCDIYGVTFLGRNHKADQSRCQDKHLFADLGDGWYCLVVSDGAGSASQSHRGARINCELSCHLLSSLVTKLGWKDKDCLPSDIEWHMHFYELCRSLKMFTSDKVESLDEKVSNRDFNATLIAMIVSPRGILTGHLGDGRMGYLDHANSWHSLMTPHRGDEPNQTVFIMNAWDKVRFPHLTMSGVTVPETKVVAEPPQAVVLLTDGCENFCWNCTQQDQETGRYRDINTPFVPFWDKLLDRLKQSATSDEAYSIFTKYIDAETAPCRDEGDDRSLILGVFKEPKEPICDE
jgi:hypothetical protein